MKWMALMVFVFVFDTMIKSQNVGVGILSPLAKLHIQDGGLLINGDIGNTPTTGTGTRMMWIPAKKAFCAGDAVGDGWDSYNIGKWSFAFGFDCIAYQNHSFAFGEGARAFGHGSLSFGVLTNSSGGRSVAIGSNSVASAFLSTSIGDHTVASGTNTVAMGHYTRAIGEYSVALGIHTKTKSYSGTVIGNYNDTTNAADPFNNNVLNRLFQIGNGTADNARSNAMTVLQNGNVGIGSLTPVSRLQVTNGAVLFDGYTGNAPVSGPGRRLMWIPSKGAFRAGEVYGNGWNQDSIGFFSVAMGENCIAKGTPSVALGFHTRAIGLGSTAFGWSTRATGFISTAWGNNTLSSGSSATAFGISTKALGNISSASGYQTKSKSYGGTVIGTYNDSTNAASMTDVNPNNRLFQIGNGTADNMRSNAMTVLQNGNVGIGVITPTNMLDVGGRMRVRYGASNTAGIFFNKSDNSSEAGFVGMYADDYIGLYGAGVGWAFLMNTLTGNVGIGAAAPTEKLNVIGNGLFTGTVTASCGVLVCSDIRYKKNILPVTNALINLQFLHGIYYHWDKEKFTDKAFTDERQIGFSAQELEKVYPEMVHTDANGYKTVDYSRLTPVLVEAIKEQQLQIDQLNEKVEWLLREMKSEK